MSYWISATIRNSATGMAAFDAEDAAMQAQNLLRRGATSVQITVPDDDAADDGEQHPTGSDAH